MKSKSLFLSLFIVTCSLFIVNCDNPSGGDDPPSNVSVTGVTLNPTSLNMAADDEPRSLTATVSPGNATDKSVIWSTSNAAVATVSAGTVTPVAVGTATITVTTTDGGFTATCAVTVTAAGTKTYSISLDESGPQTFPDATVGYTAQTPLTVTVTNTGNQATGSLTAALSGIDEYCFTLSKTAINSIAVGSNATFTVAPNTGLAMGTYTATVTVSGSSVTSQTFSVSFTVNLALTRITLNTASVKKTYTQGETLNLSGLVVTASYDNSSTAPVTGYSASPANNTTLSPAGTTTVTISYTAGAVTRKAYFTVTALASPVTYSIAGKTPAEITTDIQTELNAGKDVTVTGTLAGVGLEQPLWLTIPAGRTVNWEADYSGEAVTGFYGDGDFVIASGASIASAL